jgi:hypothetical protein
MSFTNQLQKKPNLTSQAILLSTGMFNRSAHRQADLDEDMVMAKGQVGGARLCEFGGE